MSNCELCGEPLPPGEEMFKYHGYSCECPKPPLPKPIKDTVTIPRADYEAYRAKAEAWDLVEKLRAPEGHSVTLMCDNPDFNGQPDCAIEVYGDWTGWNPRRFTGDTVLEALLAALRAAGILEGE